MIIFGSSVKLYIITKFFYGENIFSRWFFIIFVPLSREHRKVCFGLPETIRVTLNALSLQGAGLSSKVG